MKAIKSFPVATGVTQDVIDAKQEKVGGDYAFYQVKEDVPNGTSMCAVIQFKHKDSIIESVFDSDINSNISVVHFGHDRKEAISKALFK